MSKSIFGFIIAMFASLLVKAEQPTFNISSADANPGDIIDINFQVDNFGQIISVQYSVNWNPDVLEFRALKNFNPDVPGLSPSVFGTFQSLTDQGKFTLSWIESSITPITIPDGSLFFTVEFEVVGDPCQSTGVVISGDPLEIEVSDVIGEIEGGLIANNGTVNIPGSGCSEDILMVGNSIIGPCGGNACVQFTVQNFNDVGLMEFSMSYDPAVLAFDEFRNFAPLPGFGAGNTNLYMPGILRVLWFNSNIENSSLPDGTVLFEICFDVIGTGGQSSEITFGNDPEPKIANIDDEPYGVIITPAEITAQCALEGFALIADTVCAMPNGEVCMDIKINDFDDLIALQFSINWNPALFEFNRVEAFGIPGLDTNGFGTPGFPDVDEGELVLSWIDLSLEGVTLPDFTTIFRLCLDVVGSAGTSSPFTFTANPLDIEIATIDSNITNYTLLHGLGEIKASCDCDQLSYTLTSVDPNCPGACNGSLNLSVNENCPEAPTFIWSNGNTTEDISNLCAGLYTVTITLGTQIVIASANVNDPEAISVTGTINNPDPVGSSTGSVDISVMGGSSPYTYVWSNNTFNQDLTNVPAGVYTVTVTDSNGCTFVPDPYVVGADLVAAITNVSCPGGNNGSINLSVSFGTGPYTYNWNTNPVQTTEDIANLRAGSYCVTVTDVGGTSRDTCFNVTQPSPLVVTASVTNDINENCQGAIDLNVTGGNMPYTYQWSTGATTQDITQLCGGLYCVTITYGQGCTFDTCFTVFSGDVGVSLVATQYGDFQISCSGECDGQIMSVVTGGAGTLTYRWSNGETTPDITGLCAGTYTLTVTDEEGRTSIATIVLNQAEPFSLAYLTTSPSDFVTSDGAISVIVNGGVPPYTYQWSGPVTGSTAALNNVPAGTYTILITDATGCEILDSEQLLPELDVDCYTAMKVFTPNSDGKNDVFIITCVLDFENHLYIYNRFGGLVYETEDYQNDWIGIDQDGQAVPDGGYLWVLEVNRPGFPLELIKGTVNLLRTAD